MAGISESSERPPKSLICTYAVLVDDDVLGDVAGHETNSFLVLLGRDLPDQRREENVLHTATEKQPVSVN